MKLTLKLTFFQRSLSTAHWGEEERTWLHLILFDLKLQLEHTLRDPSYVQEIHSACILLINPLYVPHEIYDMINCFFIIWFRRFSGHKIMIWIIIDVFINFLFRHNSSTCTNPESFTYVYKIFIKIMLRYSCTIQNLIC